jgi:hypothetical protein
MEVDMTSGKSEHERIVDLEQALPNLAAQVAALDVRISGVEDLGRSPSSALQAAGPVGLGTPAFALFPSGPLFGCVSAAEVSGAQAGEAVTQMEDAAEDLELELEDLLRDVMPNTITDVEKKNQKAARERLGKALTDARAAKNKVGAAAAAAKKFGAAKDSIVAAEDSFNQAARKLREFDRTSKFEENTQRLRDAQKLIKDDLDKLKDALAAITA